RPVPHAVRRGRQGRPGYHRRQSGRSQLSPGNHSGPECRHPERLSRLDDRHERRTQHHWHRQTAGRQVRDRPHAERNPGAAAQRNRFDSAKRTFDDARDRKSTRLNSSHRTNSYAVFCLKKKKIKKKSNKVTKIKVPTQLCHKLMRKWTESLLPILKEQALERRVKSMIAWNVMSLERDEL